jgi:hypothetical protein
VHGIIDDSSSSKNSKNSWNQSKSIFFVPKNSWNLPVSAAAAKEYHTKTNRVRQLKPSRKSDINYIPSKKGVQNSKKNKNFIPEFKFEFKN